MSIAGEFKEFAVKGNVMDLAVGVIIGAAFGKIVDALVNDIIMPVVGRLFGGLDFSNYFIKLAPGPDNVAQTYVELKKAGVPLLAYGMVRQMNRLKRQAPPPASPEDVTLLREIRDSLRAATTRPAGA